MVSRGQIEAVWVSCTRPFPLGCPSLVAEQFRCPQIFNPLNVFLCTSRRYSGVRGRESVSGGSEDGGSGLGSKWTERGRSVKAQY